MQARAAQLHRQRRHDQHRRHDQPRPQQGALLFRKIHFGGEHFFAQTQAVAQQEAGEEHQHRQRADDGDEQRGGKVFHRARAEEIHRQARQQHGHGGVRQGRQRRAPGAAHGDGRRVGARFAQTALQEQREAARGQGKARQHAGHAGERHAGKGELAEENDGQKRPDRHAQRRRRTRQAVAGDEADDGQQQRRRHGDEHQRSGVFAQQRRDLFQTRIFHFQRHLARGEDGRQTLRRPRALGGGGVAGQGDEAHAAAGELLRGDGGDDLSVEVDRQRFARVQRGKRLRRLVRGVEIHRREGIAVGVVNGRNRGRGQIRALQHHVARAVQALELSRRADGGEVAFRVRRGGRLHAQTVAQMGHGGLVQFQSVQTRAQHALRALQQRGGIFRRRFRRRVGGGQAAAQIQPRVEEVGKGIEPVFADPQAAAQPENGDQDDQYEHNTQFDTACGSGLHTSCLPYDPMIHYYKTPDRPQSID